MKRPQDLFDLIKSLTPAEKGYFKKYVAKGDGKKYLKLFDAINAMEEYDEEKLRKKMGKELSNLSAAKGYLYESILEALRTNSKYAVEYSTVHRWLEYSSWLYDRKLFTQMPAVLMRGLELAKKTIPEYQLIYEAQLRNVYMLLNDYEKLDEFIENGYAQQLGSLDTATLQLKANLLTVLIMKLNEFPEGVKTKTSVQQTIDQIEELIKDLDYPTGDRIIDSKICSGLVSYYKYRNDSARAFVFARYCYEIANMDEMAAINVMLAYSGYLVMCRDLCLDDEVRAVAMEGKKLLVPGLPENCLSVYTRNEYFNQLYFQIERPASTDQALIDSINEWLLHSQHMSQGHKNALFFRYVQLYFMRGNYSKAIFYLNEIQGATEDKDPLYYKTALLIQLLIYFEIEDWENLQRFLLKANKEINQNTPIAAELILLSLFTAAAKGANGISMKSRLHDLQSKLQELNGQESPRSVITIFPFRSWLKSRLTGQELRQVFLDDRKQKQKENLEKIAKAEEELAPLLGKKPEGVPVS